MLLELNIRDVALIERLRVPFSSGLHVLTGETGAGKSIVIDAVTLAMRASPLFWRKTACPTRKAY